MMSLTQWVVTLQLISIVLTVLVMFSVYWFRKKKTVEHAMWTLMASVALGSVLMEIEVLMHTLEPTVAVCIISPWLREIGFVACYGSINLKMYRIMMHFRTRKAHRWSVREHDLLGYLFVAIFVTCLYMSAYTVSTLNFINEGISIILERTSPDGIKYRTCRIQWWSHVTETGELTLVMVGIRFAVACSHAVVRYDERRFLYYSLLSEALVSTIYYAVRSTLYEMTDGDPDVMLTVLYLRGVLTNVIILAMIFVPKLLEDKKTISQEKHSVIKYSVDAQEVVFVEDEDEIDVDRRSTIRQLLDLASLYLI